jgi:hypothetical protein
VPKQTDQVDLRRASFRATLLLGGTTATGIKVPDEVVASLGSGKKPAVKVTIKGHTYPSTVVVVGGKFMLPVSAENRSLAGVGAGDVVDVEVELDTEPRVLTIPPDFAHALEQDAAAKKTFDGLSRSVKQWHVLSIEGAKTAETRERSIAMSIGTLHEGKPR